MFVGARDALMRFVSVTLIVSVQYLCMLEAVNGQFSSFLPCILTSFCAVSVTLFKVQIFICKSKVSSKESESFSLYIYLQYP